MLIMASQRGSGGLCDCLALTPSCTVINRIYTTLILGNHLQRAHKVPFVGVIVLLPISCIDPPRSENPKLFISYFRFFFSHILDVEAELEPKQELLFFRGCNFEVFIFAKSKLAVGATLISSNCCRGGRRTRVAEPEKKTT